MKGKSADLELREKAFRIYRECGGNKEMTLRALDSEGYSISKPTLYDWIKKYNFDERLTSADLKTQKANDAVLAMEQKILADLLKQKEKYERFFDGLGAAIDNQALYAYNNLISTIVSVKAKLGADRAALFTEFLKDFVGYLTQNSPEAVKALEEQFDGFVEFAREKYGA